MIEAKSLTKHYGEKVAVDQLSFTVRPGVVTGFLGPNGSGKSTTMRMIMGLDAPTAGDVTVKGLHYHDLPWPLHEVGALLEAKAIHPGRSARAHLQMLAEASHIPRARIDEVLDLVGLSAVARPAGGQVLARHGAAARDCCGVARRPRGAALRRTRERTRPRRHPLGTKSLEGLWRARAVRSLSRAT